MANKLKKSNLKEPKKRLERLIAFVALLVAYFYIYVYQNMLHIEVELVSFQTLIQMPLVAFVIIPLIHYFIIKPDPLQRSPSQRKAIRFFQSEFPSKHILERCERCREDENSCPNYIKAESYAHIRYWFHDIFHGEIEKKDPSRIKDTFDKGYNCKLLYYSSWILGVFSVLAIVTIAIHHAYLYFFKEFKFDLTPLQVFFPLVCVGIIILIKKLNKPDESKPSGAWHAWREVNRIHVSWLKSHEGLLVNLICEESGGTKRFVER